jgi:hypothetical protein
MSVEAATFVVNAIVADEVATFETAIFETVIVTLPAVVAETLADFGLALPAASYAIT